MTKIGFIGTGVMGGALARAVRKKTAGEELLLSNLPASVSEALAAELASMRHRRKELVDPLQFAMSIQDADLADYVPTFRWEKADPTLDQMRAIQNFGVDPSGITTKGQASELIGALVRRAAGGYATPKQVRLLERFGFVHVGTWGKDDASRMISRISINKWRVPRSVDPATYRPGDAA